MLRNLLDEVMRRRLWPIPLVALLVAIAAPLLFLKSTPAGAPPASTAAPAAAPAGELPARAQRLITGSEVVAATSRGPRSRKSDPFQAPSSHRDSKAAPAGDSAGAEKSAPAADSPGAPAGEAQPSSGAAEPQPTAPESPTSPSQPEGDDAPPSSGARLVDVRFGARRPARMYRRIPRLQTFVADGAIVAIFVKYSPTRKKAVFAIAPGTRLEGDIKCRRKQGLCRYLDIPAGKGVRLTIRDSDGTRIHRRIDVHRIKRARSGTTVTASSAPANGSCLLDKMLALGAGDLPPAGDACTG